MSPTDVIRLIEQLPYGGRLVAWLPVLIMAGAMLATVVAPPALDASTAYRVFYRGLQWCALNIGRARNSSDPVAQADVLAGQLAGAHVVTTGGTADTPAEVAQVAKDVVTEQSAITAVKVRP